MPTNVFQGIPGIDMDVGLDYYDRFEWLIRTIMRAANDNLIVERFRQNTVLCKEISENSSSIDTFDEMQYGDKVIIIKATKIKECEDGVAFLILFRTNINKHNFRNKIRCTVIFL